MMGWLLAYVIVFAAFGILAGTAERLNGAGQPMAKWWIFYLFWVVLCVLGGPFIVLAGLKTVWDDLW